MFTNLQMLYATHVLEGKRTIESVPEVIRDAVAKIVNEAIEAKKQEEEGQ